jgi:endonuclease YncB( thermonuclease family)
MSTHRFLIAVVVTSFVLLSDFGAAPPKTNTAEGAEQKTTAHSSAPQMSTGHFSAGHTNTSRSASIKPAGKSVGHAGAQLQGTMAAHRTDAVLRAEVQATSSKVQQQLQASGSEHRRHQHWHWGQYSYLPTNSASLVVGVPSGNTLAVVNPGTQNVGLTRVGSQVTSAVGTAHGVRHGVVAAPAAGQLINSGGTIQRVRLAGVAAPVAGQTLYSESQQHLSALANGKHVRVFQTGVDPDGTIVGQIFLSNSGINLNEKQIRDGMAFNSVHDGFASSLAAAEEAALTARTGLWKAKHPIAPWLVTP